MKIIVTCGLIFIFQRIVNAKIEVKLPDDYDKHEIPNGTQKVWFKFKQVQPTFIDFRGQKLKIKYWIINSWQESRFNVSGKEADFPERIILTHSHDSLWFPKLMILEKMGQIDFVPDLKIFNPEGNVVWFVYFRQIVDIICPMSFDDFPFDEHICNFTVISITGLEDKLVLKDKTNYSIFSKEFHFEDTTYKIIKRNVGSPGGFSGVGIQFKIRRSLSQIVASHYLPSALLVGISWLR